MPSHEGVTSEQLQGFIPVLLSMVKIDALLAGNLTREVCREGVGGESPMVHSTGWRSLCQIPPLPSPPLPTPLQQALGLVTSVENTLRCGACKSLPMPDSQFVRHREIQLPAGEGAAWG